MSLELNSSPPSPLSPVETFDAGLCQQMVDSRSGFLRSTYLVELFVCITDRFRPKEPSKNTLDREKITVEDIKSAQSGSEIKQKSMASSCENRQENSGMITSNWAIGRSQRPRGKV